MTTRSVFSYALRIAVVFILFAVGFVTGSSVMAGKLPTGPTEPGLVSPGLGLLIIGLVETAVISALILTSRWGGWKLAALTALAYYGAVTVMTQIETWYFLTSLTVSPAALAGLFIMRLPIALIVIPLAVWILGKGSLAPDTAPNPALVMPVKQWIWKLALIVVAYVILYLSAGYFIAWQNPELREFYTGSTRLVSFNEQLQTIIRDDTWLIPFQMLRALLWTLCALPIIRGSRLNAWWTASLVGALLSLPQNIGHILANPLIPIASVRLSHMIETASSTFVFGLIVVWLLHRKHDSVGELFGLNTAQQQRAAQPDVS